MNVVYVYPLGIKLTTLKYYITWFYMKHIIHYSSAYVAWGEGVVGEGGLLGGGGGSWISANFSHLTKKVGSG